MVLYILIQYAINLQCVQLYVWVKKKGGGRCIAGAGH